MIDAESGEILAMSQSGSPNFNLAGTGSKEETKNALVEAVFEPGSIFKPLVAAAAIEEGLFKDTDIINCENGKYPFMKHVIKDVHPSGAIPFFDVVVRSSNIGMTKIGIRLGKERLYDWIRRFGFGYNTKLGLPGETAGILRHVNSWSGVDVATHSFGQGVAVTPLQIVRGVAAVANGGKLPTLKLLVDQQTPEPLRIISEKTAGIVQEMMYGVVEDEHGTGGKAEIEGLRVGGKTGTAQKARADGKGYAAGSYVASFVGFADMAGLGVKKKLVLLVTVDEARTTSIYGGTLAAPVFKRVIQRTAHMMVTRASLGQDAPTVPVHPYIEAKVAPKDMPSLIRS
jgi:cell division protein FtsI (penicillin-binding protein 3)